MQTRIEHDCENNMCSSRTFVTFDGHMSATNRAIEFCMK